MSTLNMLSANNQKGTVHLLIPVIILVTVSLIALGKVQTSNKFPDSNIQGINAQNLTNKSVQSSNKGSSLEEVSLKQEVRVSDKKIKAEIREDEAKAKTASQGNIKNKLESEKNKIIIKTEIEDADEDNDDEASESSKPDDSEIIQELRAISKFPLRIDLATNQLIMTKNGVERILTILPAKAVQNMLRAHLKKGLGPKFFQTTATPSATPVATSSATPSATPSVSPEEPIATESANITILEDQISLEEENGLIVYKIPAKKHLKLFGFIPITTDITGSVSAQTGVLIEEKESFMAKILDLLSP